jgi:anti-sigma regulatory factor (Ser/Thr protein kinase)
MVAIGGAEPAEGSLTHRALFYRDTAEYVSGTVPFVRAGLELGEPVLVAVPGPSLHLMHTALGTDAVRAVFVDMTEIGRNPGRIIPKLLHRFTSVHPRKRKRVVAETFWPGRRVEEHPACVQHEALVNLALADVAVTIMCPCDVEALDARTLEDVRATHPVIIDGKGEYDNLEYAVEGVLQACNQPLPEPTVRAAETTFDATNLGMARALAVRRAGDAGLASDRIIDVQLAVSELAANTLTHGGGTGRLRVWTENTHLICEVRDTGHITDPLVGRLPVDTDRHGGRGVLLVNYLSDLVRLRSGPDGTTIRAYFAL